MIKKRCPKCNNLVKFNYFYKGYFCLWCYHKFDDNSNYIKNSVLIKEFLSFKESIEKKYEIKFSKFNLELIYKNTNNLEDEIIKISESVINM